MLDDQKLFRTVAETIMGEKKNDKADDVERKENLENGINLTCEHRCGKSSLRVILIDFFRVRRRIVT